MELDGNGQFAKEKASEKTHYLFCDDHFFYPNFRDGESIKENNTFVDWFQIIFTHTEFRVNGVQVKL